MLANRSAAPHFFLCGWCGSVLVQQRLVALKKKRHRVVPFVSRCGRLGSQTLSPPESDPDIPSLPQRRRGLVSLKVNETSKYFLKKFTAAAARAGEWSGRSRARGDRRGFLFDLQKTHTHARAEPRHRTRQMERPHFHHAPLTSSARVAQVARASAWAHRRCARAHYPRCPARASTLR